MSLVLGISRVLNLFINLFGGNCRFLCELHKIIIKVHEMSTNRVFLCIYLNVIRYYKNIFSTLTPYIQL